MNSSLKEKLKKLKEENKKYFSFEFFPPKNESEIYNLYDRITRMASYEPLFINITWDSYKNYNDNIRSINLCSIVNSMTKIETVLHITLSSFLNKNNDSINIKLLKESLKKFQSFNIKNLLICKGNKDINNNNICTINFIKLIKELDVDHYFTIGISAYPELHPNDLGNLNLNIDILIKKIQLGIDFIITSHFYHYQLFMKWYTLLVDQLNQLQIDIPAIICGILPIQSYKMYQQVFNVRHEKKMKKTSSYYFN